MLKDNRIRFVFVMLLAIGAAAVLSFLPLNLGLDLKGGLRLVLEARPGTGEKFDAESLQGTIKVIRQRVDGLGVAEPVIQRKGDKQIIVELPGLRDSQRAATLIGKTALLEFVEAERVPEGADDLSPEQIEVLAGPGAVLTQVPIYNKDGSTVSSRPILLKQPVLTGKFLSKVWPGTDQYGRPICNISFNPQGSKLFFEVTQRNIGKPLAILLDGKVISAPTVQTAIAGGQAYIEGLTLAEMKDLVNLLKAGALPVPVELVESKIVGPSLGKDAIAKSQRATWVGLGVLVLFMLAFYRILGLVALAGLALYALFTFAGLIALNTTLTLPGIAGFVLSLGMAVDGNIIIYERIKEEMRAGKAFAEAVSLGWQRAFATILDSNVTTLMPAIFLFWFGTGSVKGFAVTLTLGILVSMVTVLFVSRVLVDGLVQMNLSSRSFLLRK